jgi:hypothetical protein
MGQVGRVGQVGHEGFSTLELVAAMAIMVAVIGGVVTLVDQTRGSFSAQSESADMQQRMRVAEDALFKDLVVAGAGAELGGPGAGPLIRYLPPVLPYRRGTMSDDAPGTVRSDVITLMHAPRTAVATTLASAGPSPAGGTIEVEPVAGCPVGSDSCGIEAGVTVVLFDRSGMLDIFDVRRVTGRFIEIVPHGGTPAYGGYRAGATAIVQVETVTYAIKSDPATDTYQLVVSTGGSSVPLVDHLVGVDFEYWGEPQPPRLTGVPLAAPSGPWTTYGPPPPELGATIATAGYPAGENCTFAVDAASGLQVPRLPALSVGSAGALVPLAKALLDGSDGGPWCPDATATNRWDADLLRIRSIGVTLRVESASAALRGPASALFMRGGTSRGGQRWLPDQEMRFRVTPRNLSVGR